MKENNRISRRLLHTSDIHLESNQPKLLQSLVRLVDFTLVSDVHLLLIAGDLFDSNNVPDDIVNFAVHQFERLSVPVVILPGNHDCLVPGSVFERDAFRKHSDNIKIIKEAQGELIDLADLGFTVWGKSIDSYERDIKPLEGIPLPECDGSWHIATAHGYYVDSKVPLFPSYHITRQEIVSSGWDYIALGHTIRFSCVCDSPVKAYYSGSPSFSGTAAIVDLCESSGVKVTSCNI